MGCLVNSKHEDNGMAPTTADIQDQSATVNGTTLHYLAAGSGEPIYLLHGYAQNSHMGTIASGWSVTTSGSWSPMHLRRNFRPRSIGSC